MIHECPHAPMVISKLLVVLVLQTLALCALLETAATVQALLQNVVQEHFQPLVHLPVLIVVQTTNIRQPALKLVQHVLQANLHLEAAQTHAQLVGRALEV